MNKFNMKKINTIKHYWQLVLPFCLLLALMNSCAVTKKTVYFNDLSPDTLVASRIAAKFEEPRIQPDDILSIQVTTIDPQSTQIVNQTMAIQAIGASSSSNTGNQMISGFVIDKEGFVQLNLLGKVKLGGLTTFEARREIEVQALKYYNNPTVQVRFANYKITVLGEVNRPATYTVPNEKVTIFDALGLAGDLTIHGRRENILLVREEQGANELVRLNLNDSKLLQSPYFYLKQGDVIYVEPGRSKVAQTNAQRTQLIAIASSLISLLVTLAVRL
ncbi:polysaccharide export outer membrane protein [Sphingobacterium alkalisoli]|nr:polysaccharide export outer membrane protein [Sphingobacterium alkalisoli]